jgi:tagatose-1,6-bisphosphate aldolase non-catalytic subunit AgaZ/GatZ
LQTVKTITIDIINEKVLKILQDLELLQLIRVRKNVNSPFDWKTKYKGSLKTQPLEKVNSQLDNLRQEWS